MPLKTSAVSGAHKPKPGFVVLEFGHGRVGRKPFRFVAALVADGKILPRRCIGGKGPDSRYVSSPKYAQASLDHDPSADLSAKSADLVLSRPAKMKTAVT